MPMSKNPRRYADVQRILDVALAKGRCEVQFKSAGVATNTRHRTYAFQKLMEKLDPSTPYTGFKLIIDRATPLLMSVEPYELDGVILTEYDESDLAPPQASRTDDPLAAVEAMMREEGLIE